MPNRIQNRFINASLRYNGSGDDVTPSGTWGGATWASMTWVAWVKMTGTIGDQAAIISSTSTNFMHLQTTVIAGTGSIAVYHNLGTALLTAPKQEQLCGGWHHVAITAMTGEQKFYLDGVLFSSDTDAFTNITQATALRFGEGFGSGRAFPGNITDIACFKAADTTAALTQAQVQEAMVKGPSTAISSTLYGYWKHTDGVNATLTDTVTANNGTITGATWSPEVPVAVRPSVDAIPFSIEFNGTNQSGSTAAIDLSASDKLVIALWAKSNGVGFSNIMFEFSTNYNAQAGGFALAFQPYGASIGLRGNIGYDTFEAGGLNPKVWNRYVFVMDKSAGATGETRVYVNGKLAGSKAFDNNNTNNFGNLVLYVMARNNTSNYTGGNICEVRFVKDYAWTATDVLNDYLNNIVPASGTTVALWLCNEGSGTTLTDSSGNGRTITLLNTPTWSTDSPMKARTAVT